MGAEMRRIGLFLSRWLSGKSRILQLDCHTNLPSCVSWREPAYAIGVAMAQVSHTTMKFTPTGGRIAASIVFMSGLSDGSHSEVFGAVSIPRTTTRTNIFGIMVAPIISPFLGFVWSKVIA
jgi:hypothetical protein